MKVVNRELLAAAMAVLATSVGQASAQTVVFATLNETFESYPTGAQLPAPWINGDLAYSVADGYSTNASHVAKVTQRIREDCVYMVHGFCSSSKVLRNAYRKGADDQGLITRYAVDPICGSTGMRVNFVKVVSEI